MHELDKQTSDDEIPVNKPVTLVTKTKLEGFDFHKIALKSAKLVVAPMVDQSEHAWRLLSREYGAELCYTPMIHSKIFLHTFGIRKSNYQQFMIDDAAVDRPLVAQFCANDPAMLLEAVTKYMSKVRVNAVDLNLGCPQGIAKRGVYGAYLMEDWALIDQLIRTLHDNIDVPVTAKIRVFDSAEKTLEYAKMIQNAGAQLITVHGRTRDMKGQNTGIADWDIIRSLKAELAVPVFANGNILYHRDLQRIIDYTGCDGVMVAETNLYNPALFAPSLDADHVLANYQQYCVLPEFKEFLGKIWKDYPLLVEHPPAHIITLHYLTICMEQLQQPGFNTAALTQGSMRGHIFKLLRTVLAFHLDYRPRLAKAFKPADWIAIVRELGELIENDILNHKNTSNAWSLDWLSESGKMISDKTVEGVPVDGDYYRILPYWALQPYIRSYSDDLADLEQVKDEQKESNQDETVIFLEQKLMDQRTSFLEKRHTKKEARTKRQPDPADPSSVAKKQKKNIKCLGCTVCRSPKCAHNLCKKCCIKRFHGIVKANLDPIVSEETSILNVEMIRKHFSQDFIRDHLCLPHSSEKWLRALDPTPNEQIGPA